MNAENGLPTDVEYTCRHAVVLCFYTGWLALLLWLLVGSVTKNENPKDLKKETCLTDPLSHHVGKFRL